MVISARQVVFDSRLLLALVFSDITSSKILAGPARDSRTNLGMSTSIQPYALLSPRPPRVLFPKREERESSIWRYAHLVPGTLISHNTITFCQGRRYACGVNGLLANNETLVGCNDISIIIMNAQPGSYIQSCTHMCANNADIISSENRTEMLAKIMLPPPHSLMMVCPPVVLFSRTIAQISLRARPQSW